MTQGFALAFAPCFGCDSSFGFNPHKVPSIRIKDVRLPVCQRCMEIVNTKRKAAGLPPHPIEPDAYQPIPEEEL